MSHVPERLVLFDGVCGLCDRAVTWLMEHDEDDRLRFAPLQGETAGHVLSRHPDAARGRPLGSMLYVVTNDDGEAVYRESRAMFRILAELRSPWRALSGLRHLPAPLTDLAYRAVARTRYRIWGRRDECRLPTAADRHRLLP